MRPRRLTGVAVAFALLVTATGCVRATPSRTVRVVNTTPFEIAVDVSAEGGAWTPLTVLRPDDSDTVEDVRDQGDEWWFRFVSAGVHGGTLRVSAEKLRNDKWTVEVPGDVTLRLQRHGVRAAPRSEGADS